MTRRGQASLEVLLVAAAIAALAAAGIRQAGRSPADARAAVQAMASAAAAGSRVAPAGSGAAAVAASLAALGIRETTPNAGPWIDAFTDGHPEPWCADFVSWVLRSAGAPLTGGASGGWRVAGVAALRSWFAIRGRWSPRAAAEPEAGDVVVFRHGHAGVVLRAVAGSLETVEGNAGDAVAIRRYPAWRQLPDIAGFGRP
jgi:hypothetical protein